jgi:hypothetical protein
VTGPAWTYRSEAPSVEGWYGIVKCWCDCCGLFPDVSCWSGKSWEFDGAATIVGFAGPFQSELEASEWVDANDPEV